MATPNTNTLERIAFWVPGVPKPEPRPRAPGRAGGPIYVPRSSEPWKQQIRALAASQVASRGIAAPWSGPIGVRFVFVMPSKSGVDPWDLPQDWDNLAKAAQDALGTGRGTASRWAPILWHDDRQVVEASVRKLVGNPAGLWIEAEQLDDALVEMWSRQVLV